MTQEPHARRLARVDLCWGYDECSLEHWSFVPIAILSRYKFYSRRNKFYYDNIQYARSGYDHA